MLAVDMKFPQGVAEARLLKRPMKRRFALLNVERTRGTHIDGEELLSLHLPLSNIHSSLLFISLTLFQTSFAPKPFLLPNPLPTLPFSPSCQ